MASAKSHPQTVPACYPHRAQCVQPARGKPCKAVGSWTRHTRGRDVRRVARRGEPAPSQPAYRRVRRTGRNTADDPSGTTRGSSASVSCCGCSPLGRVAGRPCGASCRKPFCTRDADAARSNRARAVARHILSSDRASRVCSVALAFGNPMLFGVGLAVSRQACRGDRRQQLATRRSQDGRRRGPQVRMSFPFTITSRWSVRPRTLRTTRQCVTLFAR